MNHRRGTTYYKKRHRQLWIVLAFFCLLVAGTVAYILIVSGRGSVRVSPEKLLVEYMQYISEREYDKMYEMTAQEASGGIGREQFIKRNSAIYEGIEAQDIVAQPTAYDKEKNMVRYETSFHTVAGEIRFENEAFFVEDGDGYKLLWKDSLIFPELSSDDQVRVSTKQARRGNILDRNGRVLAGKGTAVSVGIVPGKLENREESVRKIARLLQVKPEVIEKKLSAKWVKDDLLVPIQTIPKVKKNGVMSTEPDEKEKREQKRQKKLLEIPGVTLSDTEVREYPLGCAAAHLVGYVQGVTAEDLEQHDGEGYTTDSVIGRNGMEGLFEKELKGENGCVISVVDSHGEQKQELACVPVQHGKDVRLTIDAGLQNELYEQFREDKSCSAAINPYTGEVLALVSTPSFDNNDFIMGLSKEQWKELDADKNKPMFNRFRQVWCPGSTFKPVTAAIGLKLGTIDPAENGGRAVLRWQKDASWGSYHITTLHTYEPVNLENALIHSDNIYFAKAALKIGAENMKTSLMELGFNAELPFEIQMAKSQYSNTDKIETEIQLADSGYGQGQVLVNPLHMACIYSAFCNAGNVIKPYLVYKEDAKAEYWIPSVFPGETVNRVLEGMKKVVNDSAGTGYAAHRTDMVLAGKTGTAEIKASKEDTSGTELGWFALFTAEKGAENPVLVISMTEDVKNRGGSSYVVKRDSMALEKWFGDNSKPKTEQLLVKKREKGYDLSVGEAEREEAQADCQKMMELVFDLYDRADKGNALNVALSDQVVLSMRDKIKQTGCPVYAKVPYSDMQNEKSVEKFLKNCKKGTSGSVVMYEVCDDGGIGRNKFVFDGRDMYVLSARAFWGEGRESELRQISYTKVDEWKYTKKGWFCYELCVPEPPEVSEMVDGGCMVRIRPRTKKERELSKKCVQVLGYQGNNLLCSNWDQDHLEGLDYNGLYEYLYEMKYHKKFELTGSQGAIPQKEFEGLIMEYLPVTSGQLRKYAVYDEKSHSYAWQRLGCFNYDVNAFGTSVPEITGVKENKDGTVTLTVDAVCEMLVCEEAVITHELTVRFAADGSFQYIGNRILQDGIRNIPDYKYRI